MRGTLTLLAALAGAIVLSGCGKTPEERAAERIVIQSQLPDTCAFVDLGAYGSLKTVVAVICDGRPSTTTNYSWTEQQGKSSVTRSASTVTLP